MDRPVDVSFQVGIPEHSRLVAAELYDEAFGRKLQVAIPDDSIRKAVFVAGMDLQRGIAALDEDGALVGLAGFHDAGGSLTGLIDFKILRDHIGLGGAIRAFFVFALLDRKPEKGELLMDGIVVSERARGRGIGSGLFSALEEYAVGEGLRTIRLASGGL